MARGVRQCRALRTRLRTTTAAAIAEISAPRRATLDTTDIRSVLTGDKIPVVAINATVSHAVIGGAAGGGESVEGSTTIGVGRAKGRAAREAREVGTVKTG